MRPPLLALVDRQWGVVSRWQLLALGVGRGAIEHWLATGRLRPLHRGVYAYGHASLRVEGRWMAAVLACGPGAALHGRSAAACLDLLPYASATIHVVCDRKLGRQPGIHPHRARSLDARDVTIGADRLRRARARPGRPPAALRPIAAVPVLTRSELEAS